MAALTEAIVWASGACAIVFGTYRIDRRSDGRQLSIRIHRATPAWPNRGQEIRQPAATVAAVHPGAGHQQVVVDQVASNPEPLRHVGDLGPAGRRDALELR